MTTEARDVERMRQDLLHSGMMNGRLHAVIARIRQQEPELQAIIAERHAAGDSETVERLRAVLSAISRTLFLAPPKPDEDA